MAKKKMMGTDRGAFTESFHWSNDMSNDNLPAQSFKRTFPKCSFISDRNMYDDTMEGIDRDRNDMVRGVDRMASKVKY